jgi:hypothetical protein
MILNIKCCKYRRHVEKIRLRIGWADCRFINFDIICNPPVCACVGCVIDDDDDKHDKNVANIGEMSRDNQVKNRVANCRLHAF